MIVGHAAPVPDALEPAPEYPEDDETSPASRQPSTVLLKTGPPATPSIPKHHSLHIQPGPVIFPSVHATTDVFPVRENQGIYLPAVPETVGPTPAWTESAWALPSGTSTLGSSSSSSPSLAGAPLLAGVGCWLSEDDISQIKRN